MRQGDLPKGAPLIGLGVSGRGRKPGGPDFFEKTFYQEVVGNKWGRGNKCSGMAVTSAGCSPPGACEFNEFKPLLTTNSAK